MFGLEKWLKVVDPEPVLINHQACLRARHRRSACRACSAACPPEAMGYENGRVTVDPGKCVRCGICVGACPTAALQVHGVADERLAGATRVRCSRAAGDGVELPCLGYLSADHLVDLGSRAPGLELAAGDCAACPWQKGGEQARAALASASATLLALGVQEPPRWTAAHGGGSAQHRSLTRRELLGFWRVSAVQTSQTLLPDREVNPVRLPAKVPARRLRWIKRFESVDGPATLSWPTRQAAEGCNGCTICVAFCPTGALSGREEDGVWTLGFQAAACVDCKTCMQLCPRRVLGAGGDPLLTEVLSGARRDIAAIRAADRPVTPGFTPVR